MSIKAHMCLHTAYTRVYESSRLRVCACRRGIVYCISMRLSSKLRVCACVCFKRCMVCISVIVDVLVRVGVFSCAGFDAAYEWRKIK
jgi:hypothetical protein